MRPVASARRSLPQVRHPGVAPLLCMPEVLVELPGVESRRRFARYWMVIKPTGNFVSRQLLLAIKRRAEAA